MPPSRRILLLGASGRLGAALARRLRARHTVLTPGRALVDFTTPALAAAACRGLDFDTLVNCAALTSPDACEENPAAARAINAETPAALAALCAARGARFIHISTDYVFPGTSATPLTEEDETGPLSVYGETKRAAETAILQTLPAALIARVSWLFGPDKPAFPDTILQRARAGERLSAINDKWSTPTSTEDLAVWLALFCESRRGTSGLLHLCNSGQATWQEFAIETVRIAHQLGLLPSQPPVHGASLEGFAAFRARRPRCTVMSPARFTAITGLIPRPWQEALRDYLIILHERESRSNAK